MFALPTPYIAERNEWIKQANGSMKEVWSPCRVIGVTKNDEGEPAYVVEYGSGGSLFLSIEPEIRRRGDVL